MANGRGSATLSGAASGAMTGASVGAALPIPGGAVVGAGVGALGGAVSGYRRSAPTEYEQYTEEQLNELRRRQELDALGLTDEERSQMGYQLGGAINRERMMAQEMLRQASASGDMGPEAFARQAAGAEAGMAALSAESQAQILAADLAKKQMEEQQIYELMALQYDIDAADRQAQLQQQGMYLAAAVDMADVMGAQSGFAEADRERTPYSSTDFDLGATIARTALRWGRNRGSAE